MANTLPRRSCFPHLFSFGACVSLRRPPQHLPPGVSGLAKPQIHPSGSENEWNRAPPSAPSAELWTCEVVFCHTPVISLRRMNTKHSTTPHIRDLHFDKMSDRTSIFIEEHIHIDNIEHTPAFLLEFGIRQF